MLSSQHVGDEVADEARHDPRMVQWHHITKKRASSSREKLISSHGDSGEVKFSELFESVNPRPSIKSVFPQKEVI
jgi:hypothetical protein